MAKLTEKMEQQIENLGWSICSDTSINWGSPAGEDYWIECNDPNEMTDIIKSEYENFDVDEHVEMWVDAKRSGTQGVPSTTELVEDAKAIQKMLEQLYDIIRNEPKNENLLIIDANKTIYVNIWWWSKESIVMRGYDTKQNAKKDVGCVKNLYFDETIYPFDEDDDYLNDIDILEKIHHYLGRFCKGANCEIVGFKKLKS